MSIHRLQSWKPFFLFLLILAVCKSAVNWLPERPAAGAEPSYIYIYIYIYMGTTYIYTYIYMTIERGQKQDGESKG